MSLVKQKNCDNYYIVLYSNKKQVWLNTKTTDKLEAQQMELDYKNIIANKNDIRKLQEIFYRLTGKKIEAKGLKLSECWECFLKQPGSDIKESSLKSKRLHFVEWISIESKGEIDLIHEITGDIAFRYSSSLREEKTAKTFNNYKNNITNVFQNLLAVPRANLTENVFKRIVASKVGKSKSYRHFSNDEMQRIEDKLKISHADTWYLAFMVSKYTGLRLKDCVFLKSQYVDYENKIITLITEKGSRFGKELNIPLHENLEVLLKSIQIDNREDYLFFELVQQYASGFFNNKFSTILKELDIKETKKGIVGFHSFRHTFVTSLESAGISQAVRRKLVGHSSDRINDIYSHDIKHAKEAINIIQ